MKRTPWFSGFEYPVRKGVYERRLYNYHNGEELIVYSYWDNQWYVGGYTPDEAMILAKKYGPTMTWHREWRGLLKGDDDE